MSSKEELLDEISHLAGKADLHFEEAGGFIEASYHVLCDMIRLETSTLRKRKLKRIKRSLMEWGADLHKKQQKLKTLVTELDGETENEGESND